MPLYFVAKRRNCGGDVFEVSDCRAIAVAQMPRCRFRRAPRFVFVVVKFA